MTRNLLIPFLTLTFLSSSAARQQPAQEALPAWVVDRLDDLRADQAMAYFELGEEVSYEITGRKGQDLARTLFVLAYQLDADLGPHVCLALAELTTSADERRWLLAMAESMGAGNAQSDSHRIPSGPAEESRRRLADALRTLRAEDGRPMREAMASPAAAEFLAHLQQSEPVIHSALAEAAHAASGKVGCPRCRGQRVVANSVGADRPRELCPRCGGNPGLAMTESDILNSLRVEAHLRRIEPGTWSGTLLMHQDRPLRDIRAGDLARTYAVDPAKTRWSAEQGWHAPPEPPASDPRRDG